MKLRNVKGDEVWTRVSISNIFIIVEGLMSDEISNEKLMKRLGDLMKFQINGG